MYPITNMRTIGLRVAEEKHVSCCQILRGVNNERMQTAIHRLTPNQQSGNNCKLITLQAILRARDAITKNIYKFVGLDNVEMI